MREVELQDRIDALMRSGDKLTFCEFLQNLLLDCKGTMPEKPKSTFKVVSEITDNGSPLIWVEKPVDIIMSRKGVKKTVRYEVYVETETAKDAIESGSTLISAKIATEKGERENALL